MSETATVKDSRRDQLPKPVVLASQADEVETHLPPKLVRWESRLRRELGLPPADDPGQCSVFCAGSADRDTDDGPQGSADNDSEDATRIT